LTDFDDGELTGALEAGDELGPTGVVGFNGVDESLTVVVVW